ncbi:MAG: HD domain-containing protein [Chthoniobacterales bacterium]|nr:HD domain-containing protein [Chthoniobacterales bacterium]
MTIQALREATREGAFCEAAIPAQVESLQRKETSSAKPFYELLLRDATGSLVLRAWSDKPAFAACEQLTAGDFVEVKGNFSQGSFGLDAPGWMVSSLDAEGISLLVEGSPEEQKTRETTYQGIVEAIATIEDPRLRELCNSFLNHYGPRFCRAAAARSNHHARRGGLLDHTARMLQAALALQAVYPHLHRDLLITATLFHDSGKLWETCPPAQGFGITPDLRGELMGHLSIGIELVNALWRELPKEEWKELQPASEEVRLHLLHLIAAHHGQLEYGSPVLPKTPEAIALHLIDNLDARLEMFQEAYTKTPGATSGFFEWTRPLGVAPVAPLQKVSL